MCFIFKQKIVYKMYKKYTCVICKRLIFIFNILIFFTKAKLDYSFDFLNASSGYNITVSPSSLSTISETIEHRKTMKYSLKKQMQLKV